MRKKKSRQMDDEEPKAVREMRKNKNKEIEKENKKTKRSKKDKKKRRKKIILVVITVIILVVGVILGISAHTWIILAKDMVSNESSIVIDTDGNTIARLRR